MKQVIAAGGAQGKVLNRAKALLNQATKK
jgi:hypothetical protein